MTTPDPPAAWRLDDEKRRFLLEQRARPSLSAEQTDSEQLRADWRAFAETTALALAPGLTSDAPLRAFEETVGYPMPDALAALLAESDGSEHGADFGGGLRGYRLLSAAETAKEWASWKEIFDTWTLDELAGNSAPDAGRTLGLYTTPYWVPVLHDGSGNVAAIDLLPGEAGRPGQVIAFGADEVTVRWCAPGLGALVRQLRKGADPLGHGLV